MKDKTRTKKNLIKELVALRRRIADMEKRTLHGTSGNVPFTGSGEECRDVIDHISDGVFRLNRDGYFTFVNRGIVERSGISPDTFYTLHFLDVVVPEDHERVKKNFEKALKGEPIAPYEVNYRTAHGHTVTVEISTNTIREEGEIVGIQVISRDLTERTLAKKTIKITEERFRKMVEHSTDAISLFSPEGTFLYISEAVERVLGHSPDDLIGQRWELFVHPDDLDMMATKWFQVLEKPGNIVSAEMRGRNRDGSWRWMEVVGSNQVEDPEIGAVIINFRDISERKQAEKVINESEHRFTELFENMSSCMAVYEAVDDGKDLIFKNFNKAAEKTEHVDRKDLIGKSVLDVFPGIRDMGLFEVLQRVWRTGKPEHYPATYYQDDRTEGWKENYVYKLPSGEIVAIYDDVTVQKRAELAAKESEERFRSLFDRSLEYIYIHDFEGKFIDANQAALDLLGYDRDDIPSTNLASALAPDQLSKAWKQIEILRKDGFQKKVVEYRVQRKDGTPLDIETKSSILYRDGKPYGVMGIARDITKRKQSVDRLRKAVGATVQAMATVVETRDPYTAGHQRRVADLARSIATEMGLSKDQIEGIRTAAAIHDIGKISIPSEILSKPTRLTDMELSLIQLHSQSGYDILKDIEFPWPVARMVLEHHERVDGSGYPNGLKGEAILLESRIIALADVVEAIASHRPYRPALGIDLALAEIVDHRGTQFDPKAVDACLRIFNKKQYTFIGL